MARIRRMKKTTRKKKSHTRRSNSVRKRIHSDRPRSVRRAIHHARHFLLHPLRRFRRRHTKHQRRKSSHKIPFAEMGGLMVLGGVAAKTFGIGAKGPLIPPTIPPVQPPQPNPQPRPSIIPSLMATYIGNLGDGEQQIQVTGGNLTPNGPIRLATRSGVDSTDNVDFPGTAGPDGSFTNVLAYQPDPFTQVIQYTLFDKTTQGRSQTVTVSLPAVSGAPNPNNQPPLPQLNPSISAGAVDNIGNTTFTGSGFSNNGPVAVFVNGQFVNWALVADQSGNIQTTKAMGFWAGGRQQQYTIYFLDSLTNIQSNTLNLISTN